MRIFENAARIDANTNVRDDARERFRNCYDRSFVAFILNYIFFRLTVTPILVDARPRLATRRYSPFSRAIRTAMRLHRPPASAAILDSELAQLLASAVM